MASFKEKNREGVKEMTENSRETADVGSEMQEQASEINALLESINLQDTEDIQAVGDTGKAYQSSFDSAFSEQVERAEQEIEAQGKEVQESAQAEAENVSEGARKLEKAGSVSEIGRDVASDGGAKLESSAEEYTDISADAEQVAQDIKEQVNSLKNNLSGLFG